MFQHHMTCHENHVPSHDVAALQPPEELRVVAAECEEHGKSWAVGATAATAATAYDATAVVGATAAPGFLGAAAPPGATVAGFVGAVIAPQGIAHSTLGQQGSAVLCSSVHLC